MHRCFTLYWAYSRRLSLASGRSSGWRRDPYLPTADTLALTAYRGASADWQALNYLSNITPQAANLNQGAWARLEDKERTLALRSDVAAVWSVTGPLFDGISPPCPPRPRWGFPAATGRLFLSAPVRIRANTRRFCWIRRRPKAPVFVIIRSRWTRLSGGLIRGSRSGPPCRQVSPAA